MVNNKFTFPLLLLLFSFKLCFAFKFLEDTVDVSQAYAKIGMVNDSSHAITIDSIEVILIKGTVAFGISFVAVDSPQSYPSTTVTGEIKYSKDSTYYPGNYSRRNAENKIKLPANRKSIIHDFEIGQCVGNQPTLYKSSNRLSNGVFDYVVKLIFYANDNTVDAVVCKGNIKICTEIIKEKKTVPHSSLDKTEECEYVNILGKKIVNSLTHTPKSSLIIIQNKETIGKKVLLKD